MFQYHSSCDLVLIRQSDFECPREKRKSSERTSFGDTYTMMNLLRWPCANERASALQSLEINAFNSIHHNDIFFARGFPLNRHKKKVYYLVRVHDDDDDDMCVCVRAWYICIILYSLCWKRRLIFIGNMSMCSENDTIKITAFISNVLARVDRMSNAEWMHSMKWQCCGLKNNRYNKK